MLVALKKFYVLISLFILHAHALPLVPSESDNLLDIDARATPGLFVFKFVADAGSSTKLINANASTECNALVVADADTLNSLALVTKNSTIRPCRFGPQYESTGYSVTVGSVVRDGGQFSNAYRISVPLTKPARLNAGTLLYMRFTSQARILNAPV